MTNQCMSLQEELHNCLKPQRFMHTLGVAFTSSMLASCYGYDKDQAYLAGLLHDCAKQYSPYEQLKECKRLKVPLAEDEIEAMYHSKLGAYYAKHRYGVNDPDVINAIFWHTTGRPEMSLLEKILYISDFIEPGREFTYPRNDKLNELRRLAFLDLEQALIVKLQIVIDYLGHGKSKINPITLEAYQYYRKSNIN